MFLHQVIFIIIICAVAIQLTSSEQIEAVRTVLTEEVITPAPGTVVQASEIICTLAAASDSFEVSVHSYIARCVAKMCSQDVHEEVREAHLDSH